MSIYRDRRRENVSRKGSPRGLRVEIVDYDKEDLILDRASGIGFNDELRVLERVSELKVGEALDFEVMDCSPYRYPLDGKTYVLDPSSGPRGTCPICNNAKAKEMNEYYITNLHDIKDNRRGNQSFGAYSFEPKLVLEHLVNHIGMVYADVLDSMDELPEGSELEERVKEAARLSAVRASYDRKRTDRIDHDCETEMVAIALPAIGVPLDPSPGVTGRPDGTKPKKWYAFDGDEELGPMRPWGDDRVKNEVSARADDAIVFYDEMLDVRHRARRVYDEIMDAPEPPRDEHGVPAYDPPVKNYAAAVAAVREIKGVAMDMAKLALIATKYGDESDKARQISPSMKAMLDDIGIFEPGKDMKLAEKGEDDE